MSFERQNDVSQKIYNSKRYSFLTEDSFSIPNGRYYVKIGIPASVNREEFLKDVADYFNGEYKSKSSYSSVGAVVLEGVTFVAKHNITEDPNFRIKPKDLQVCGMHKADLYQELVYSSINNTISNVQIASFLTNIVNSYAFGETLNIGMFTEPNFHETLPVGTIVNDFGEVVGPIAVLSKKLVKNSNPWIWIPPAANEPLHDYVVDDKVFSAKSGRKARRCNVVRPKFIWELIEKSKKKARKWQGSIQHTVTALLAFSSIAEGPLNVLKYLAHCNPEFKVFDSFDSTEEWFNAYKFILDDIHPRLQSEPVTRQMVLYYLEKKVTDYLKRNVDMTDYFIDAVNNEVNFAKFNVSVSPEGANTTFDLISPNDFATNQVWLRSVNSTKSVTGRMGFSI